MQKKQIHSFCGIAHNPVGPKLQWRIQHVTFKQICARGESTALSDAWQEHECHNSLQLSTQWGGGEYWNIQQKRDKAETHSNIQKTWEAGPLFFFFAEMNNSIFRTLSGLEKHFFFKEILHNFWVSFLPIILLYSCPHMTEHCCATSHNYSRNSCSCAVTLSPCGSV